MNTRTVKVTLAAAAAILMAVPAVASARDYDRYDGYCYQRKKDAGRSGAIVGAIIGGAIGSQVSKNERGLGTVGGAIIGGSIGNSAGKNSVKCYNGDYYSYESGYYEPGPAPEGYSTVYYSSRPDSDHYSRVHRRESYRNGYDDGYRRGRRDGDNW